jgi:multimeric flavodoxin WrbA/uncharacterized protein (DUF2141 family)
MKITIINGSPRKNGATGKILKRFGKCLEEKGDVEVCYVELADYGLQPCSGCEGCYRTGVCHIDDRAEEINREVAASDGVILGSPVYVSNVSGVLKNYIDRGHIVVEQALKDKYMFAVTTFEIAGGAGVTGMLNTMFRYAGGIPAGHYALRLPHNSSPFERTEVVKQIDRKAGKFYDMIHRGQRKCLLDRVIHFVALHVVIKPFVVRSPNRYQAVLQRWKAMKILLTGLIVAFTAIHPLCAQRLTVGVHNIKPVGGNLMVGVFNSETGFPDVYFKGAKVPITDTVMVVTFPGLPAGKYAVSAYQDMNENGQLDKNLFGIPKERYGFSNQANKPDYQESVFDFHKDLTLTITLK